MEYEIEDQAWSSELQAGLSEYIDHLLYGIDEPEEEIDTLSGQPFCGCDVCYWRETLFYVVPKVLDGYLSGKITVIPPSQTS